MDPFRNSRAAGRGSSGGFASVDLQRHGGAFGGGEFISESTVGWGAHLCDHTQAPLLTAAAPSLRKRGEIDRATRVEN